MNGGGSCSHPGPWVHKALLQQTNQSYVIVFWKSSHGPVCLNQRDPAKLRALRTEGPEDQDQEPLL